MTELEAILLLNSSSKVHLKNLESYLERYDSLEGILKKDPEIRERCQGFNLVEEMRGVGKRKVQLVPFTDERYPRRLKELSAPPLLLYIQGRREALDEPLAVAIVGARKATPYGLKIAREWAKEFVSYGVTVVSGLALGIDGAAHEGVIQAGGETVAVLGSGLGELYPPEHRRLADQIVERGALISEFSIRAMPATYHFPRRNRIISGLSMGVIVVEAGERSGALVTASLAGEQGKEVFAVPGRVDSPMSLGAHRLIRDGARVALSPRGVLEELAVPILQQNAGRVDAGAVPAEDAKVNFILRCLSDEPVSLEDLVKQLQRPVTELISELSLLELAGKVVRLPGARFVKP